MVCGSLNPGVDDVCNCCGCFGSCCCPFGREKCCDCCNHCFCFGESCMACCPCGAEGCIGYTNHLCGCCGNCNLMWYASCCPCCFLADLFIATDTAGPKDQEWSNIMCNFITVGVIMAILDIATRAIGGSTAPYIGQGISGILEICLYVYATVVFAYSAAKIAKKSGFTYEPADCCTGCYEEGVCSKSVTCCTSLNCCCAFFCCEGCHTLQVARALEKDQTMQESITGGRPKGCDKCCNCWVTEKPLELVTSGTAVDNV